MSRRIIVSDLHVDTWTDDKVGDTGRSKLEHFFELLDWCEVHEIDEFIINGDLMDMPPYDGQCVFPNDAGGECIARRVCNRLVVFNRHVPITYVHGNHDIGLSGFRSLAEDSMSVLWKTSFCYPDYKLEYPGQSVVLVEHGHLYDPALLLYIRDLSLRTYIASSLEAFQWAMQRRDLDHPSAVKGLGAQHPVDVQPGQNAYHTIPDDLDARQAAKPEVADALRKPSLKRRLKQIAEELGKPLIMANWREAAREEMLEYVADMRAAGKPVPPTVYLIFGHTHRTDKLPDIDLGDGTKGVYLNAGSWAQGIPQGPYLDVDEYGKIWLQDCINEDAKTRRMYE